jgi:Fe(3+) dicitrate transport protein
MLAAPMLKSNVRVLFLAGAAAALCALGPARAQEPASSTNEGSSQPDEIIVIDRRTETDIERLPAIQGTTIFSGKKSEVVRPDALNANLTIKNPRELFAKVPGVFVYDMDGAGNQVNVATRGLDPHRGWEFNIRMDGFITNSDMYGYPASHFSLPMETVERIELVRGTGALQYGAQFGGMLNYSLKQPVDDFAFTTINSVGSFDTLSSYNAVSGRVGNTGIYGYVSRRTSDGYRVAAEAEAEYYGVRLNSALGEKLVLTAGYAASEYRVQLPGPLTDAMFATDPGQATRTRNYYSPSINVPTLGLTWTPTAATTLSWTASAVRGERNSVLFDRPADVSDSISPITGTYANRQVDIDLYDSFTTAIKALHRYRFGGREHALTVGVEYMDNDTHRRQQGIGTTGSDYDLSLVVPGWGRDLHLLSDNVAVFAENRFAVSDHWFLSAGFRVESGDSRFEGSIVGYDPNELPNTIAHDFTLLGFTLERVLDERRSVYAGWSEAYRPILFKDIIPSSPLERVDKNLEDGRGHTIEVGYRGTSDHWGWDVSAFELSYRNRMGTTANFDGTTFYNLRTNIGDSNTRGVELFLQYGRSLRSGLQLTLFTSSTYMDAQYEDATARVGTQNIPVDGNQVQSVPHWISRNGVTLGAARWSGTLLYSYTHESYADALNTLTPSANGAVGLVPSHDVFDLSASYEPNTHLRLRLSVNNLADESYFTKRPEFYPGPGVWPSDGRSYNAAVALYF